MKTFAKLISLTLSAAILLMICFAVPAMALTDGDWEVQLLDNEVRILRYLGDDSEVVIPETIMGCPVTSFGYGDKVFDGNANITSVEFRPKMTEFTEYLCCDLSNLEEVILHEGIESIGSNAFWHCGKLKKINLPSTLKIVGDSAFEGCGSLTSIVLPEGIEEVHAQAFGWTGLTEIDLHNAKGYGDDAFCYCEKLERVKLSPMAENVPQRMFIGCTSLKDVEMPSGVKYIGDRSFEDCFVLESIIFPTTLLDISYKAFIRTGLREVVIPYGAKLISSEAFRECKNLEAVYIPETVTTMHINPINDCPNAIIYCTADSYAAGYCKDNGLSYLTDNSVNSGIHVYYNGKRISFHSYSQNPEILEGRTLVPLRSIFEAMGAQVEWNSDTKTATAKRGKVSVEITIGANEIYKNGKAISVDVPAQIVNDRTMVPARVIAEAFGAQVEWNANGRSVMITE